MRKKILLLFLFWWAIMFPQYNFLPKGVDENAELEIHFWFYDICVANHAKIEN